jgi:hypothetical protein
MKLMSPTRDSNSPSLAELFSRYLQRQTTAQSLGLGFGEPGETAIPHDAVPVQPVDPQLAWNDAVAVLPIFHSNAKTPSVPPDWAALVNGQAPAVSLAFALGNFPQMVRNLHPLLTREFAPERPASYGPMDTEGLQAWAGKAKEYPDKLLAAGALRLARQFEKAAQMLKPEAPALWRDAQANERAALDWHRGEQEQAMAKWQAQPESVPVLFNRGMSALFLDRPKEARASLTAAVAGLPKKTAWHHLACLYLAMA